MSKLLIGIYWCLLCLFANPQYNSFLQMQEKVHGIPPSLLQAVSHVESGRKVAGKITPWPWTINVEGKGYIFETKQKAIQAVEKFQKMGAKSIDVGIMQINLRHHPHAFHNLEEAFDPQLNIAYGAKFLKQLFMQHKSWNLAVGHYHSATPKFHNAYKQRVFSNWSHLSNKKDHPQVERAVMKFDEVESDMPAKPKVIRRSVPQEIRPFARATKVYYSLDSTGPSQPLAPVKTSYTLDNSRSKQYYSLD